MKHYATEDDPIPPEEVKILPVIYIEDDTGEPKSLGSYTHANELLQHIQNQLAATIEQMPKEEGSQYSDIHIIRKLSTEQHRRLLVNIREEFKQHSQGNELHTETVSRILQAYEGLDTPETLEKMRDSIITHEEAHLGHEQQFGSITTLFTLKKLIEQIPEEDTAQRAMLQQDYDYLRYLQELHAFVSQYSTDVGLSSEELKNVMIRQLSTDFPLSSLHQIGSNTKAMLALASGEAYSSLLLQNTPSVENMNERIAQEVAHIDSSLDAICERLKSPEYQLDIDRQHRYFVQRINTVLQQPKNKEYLQATVEDTQDKPAQEHVTSLVGDGH